MKKRIWALSLLLAAFFVATSYAGKAQLLQIKKKDGSKMFFWTEQVSKITFKVNELSSSSSAIGGSCSSETLTSSSSKTELSSSSEEHTTVVVLTKMNKNNITWDSRLQNLYVQADNASLAKVSVFDIQGVRIVQKNVPVSRGFNQVSMSSLNLTRGKYILYVDMDGVRSRSVISVGKEGR